jgi:hypothetical protein
VADLKGLDTYRYSGHGVLMGKTAFSWQAGDEVLSLFDDRLLSARRRYRRYVEKGLYHRAGGRN